MLRYKVTAKFKNKETELGIFKDLEESYRCIAMNGKGTSRKFNIDIVYEAPLGRITSKDAREILKKVGELNEERNNDKGSNITIGRSINSPCRKNN